MKIDENIHGKAITIGRRYAQLKAAFENLYIGGQYLVEPASKLESFRFEPSLEKGYFDVFYSGLQVRFQFSPYYAEDDAVQGKVLCYREHPKFSKEPDLIGSFTFNGRGITDFEVIEGRDKLEMEVDGGDIILHFIDAALAKPLI